MFNFLKKLRSSTNFVNQVSDEIGVERKLFQTSLTQMGLNFSLLEQAFAQDELHLNERIRFQRFCMRLIPMARRGAAQLQIKFGEQPQIEKLVFAMIEYQESHIDVVDNPAEYRRDAMYQ